jgi:membrane protein DedA with SNARE-associated domain
LETDTISSIDRLKNTLKRWEFWAGLSIVSLTFVLAIMVILYWENFQEFAGVSYMGLFFISIVGGATVIIPVPSLVVQFTMGAVLHPALVGAVAGLGTGIGGTLVFLFGRGGHRIFGNTGFSGASSNRFIVRWTARVMTWARHRGSLAVFFMSAVLNPVFFPMAVAIGTSRFKLWKFFVMCWAGNTVKSMIIAYLGYFGLGSILRAIGINI